MKQFPKLNLPECRLRVSKTGDGDMRVWDELRGIWLVLTPEEWVRRHVCRYLTEHAGVPDMNIIQEYPVQISGMPQRADIVVVEKEGSPVMLVECKAADVKMDAKVYAQAVRYNSVVSGRYIMITNGREHFIFGRTPEGEYEKCGDFPSLAEYF